MGWSREELYLVLDGDVGFPTEKELCKEGIVEEARVLKSNASSLAAFPLHFSFPIELAVKAHLIRLMEARCVLLEYSIHAICIASLNGTYQPLLRSPAHPSGHPKTELLPIPFFYPFSP